MADIRFFSCDPAPDPRTIFAMKPKTRIRKAAKSARRSIIKKAASKKAIVQKAVKKAAVKKMARKLPHSIQMRRGPPCMPSPPRPKPKPR